MNHAEFLKSLAEIEAPFEGPGPLARRLPPAAAAHAAACADCAGALAAIERLGTDENALADDPPESYWADFDRRLAERLAAVPRPLGAARRAPRWRWAAVAVLALGLALVARQGWQRAGAGPERAGFDPPEASEEIEDLLAAWAGETAEPSLESGLVVPADDDALPGLLSSPVDSLHDELSAELDDGQAAELARLLRAEIAS